MPLLNSYRVIYLTFFVCLVADIFPLPIMFNAFRPNWMILVIFYWIIALPHRVNIGHAFILGLILDLLLGSTLGTHGLLFSLLAYLTSINFQRFRNFTLVQTTLLLGVFIFIAKLGLYWIASSMQEIVLHRPYFWSIFTSMLIWPWFFLFMRYLRVRYKVS
ncbi:rod shape-determining protein MreD [Psychromonas sp. 14N.309.X.WAT.B.A12]|uniref:rod shape-determining protein MreD n=1 Tax=unclassified Psychromonas TaxID=2614957 RepID=UPI0025B0E894|nr:rod shape-determining protein MreD [Psychromonas sp. 14N.309.X.WAT.B.A12]MDN2663689.1 rod shape-determining protein MreD [Psychromonas sp. 14N.309.X.WAT.B.A12]